MVRFGFLLIGLLCTPLHADILWMRNGDRLSGNVQLMDDEQIRIALPYGEPLTVRRDAVKRWRLDKPAAKKTKRSSPPATTGVQSGDGNQPEPHWYLAGRSDLSLKLKRNDKVTDNIDFSGDIELANLDWRYTLEGKYIYDTVDGTTKTHKYRFRPMADYFFDSQWFWRSSIYYQYDMLSESYLSVDYGTGPGYRFWNDKRHRLETMLQGGLSRAYWRSGSNLSWVFNSHAVSYPFASFGWDYRQPLWDSSTELFSEGTYTKYLDQPSPYVTLNQNIEAALGLRYYLNDNISLAWRSELEWDDAWFEFGGITYTPSDSKEWRHIVSLGASF